MTKSRWAAGETETLLKFPRDNKREGCGGEGRHIFETRTTLGSVVDISETEDFLRADFFNASVYTNSRRLFIFTRESGKRRRGKHGVHNFGQVGVFFDEANQGLVGSLGPKVSGVNFAVGKERSPFSDHLVEIQLERHERGDVVPALQQFLASPLEGKAEKSEFGKGVSDLSPRAESFVGSEKEFHFSEREKFHACVTRVI